MENKILLGSHNSITYATPKHWYLRPFNFIARCQRVDYREQYNLGVRVFDIRIWFDKHARIIAKHGLIEYKFYEDDFFEMFCFFQEKGDCYVQLVLEYNKAPHTNDEASQGSIIEHRFASYCRYLKTSFPNIRFFGGVRKYDWKEVQFLSDFRYPFPIIGAFSSSPFIYKEYTKNKTLNNLLNNLLNSLRGLFPLLYAGQHNRENIASYKGKGCIMVDFIDIQ